MGELCCLKNGHSQVEMSQLGTRVLKLTKYKFAFSWPELIFKQNIHDYRVLITGRKTQVIPDKISLQAVFWNCLQQHHPQGTILTTTFYLSPLQLKEPGHKGVFNSESKRSETPSTKMTTKLWWNCKVLLQTKEEPQSTLKLQIVTYLRWNEEAMKKLKEEQKSNRLESSFGDKEIHSE